MSVSRTVYEIFSVKLWHDLKIWVRGCSVRKLGYGFLFAFHTNYGPVL